MWSYTIRVSRVVEALSPVFLEWLIYQKPWDSQCAFFNRCIESNLQSDLADYILPTMDVLGPSGCIYILEHRFRSLYPIFNRCCNYFRASRKAGKDSDAFLTPLLLCIGTPISKVWQSTTTFCSYFWLETRTMRSDVWFHTVNPRLWRNCGILLIDAWDLYVRT